ncbi:MAG: hypothetical protein ACEQSA_00585 [Weeksellaceae bacterium]
MAPEVFDGAAQAENSLTTEIPFYWYASKQQVSNYIEARCRGLKVGNKEFLTQHGDTGSLVGSFVHDLSHNGRGMRNFPIAFPLQLSGVIALEQTITTEQPTGRLFDALLAQIEAAKATFEYYITPQSVQAKVEVLQAMQSLLAKDSINFIMEQRLLNGQSIYAITRMNHIPYIDPDLYGNI